jgi:hypothetical protein
MRFYIVLLFIILNQLLNAQNDLVVIVHESTVNSLFKAVGTIDGNGVYKTGFINNKYSYDLENLRIDILKDSAKFYTDASVKTWLGNYEDKVVGKVAISYNEKTNIISIKVVDAPFEISVKLFGKRVVLKKLQIADYLTTPFEFEGPMTIKNELEFAMPDGSIRKIEAKPSKCKIEVLPDKIQVSTKIQYVRK